MTVLIGGGAIRNAGATAYLGANVSLNNTSNFFDVVSTATLEPGTYLISGCCVVRDTAGGANITLEVTDGTNVAVSSAVGTGSANFEVPWAFSAVVTLAAAGTMKIRARDTSAITGQALTTSAVAGATANKATYITAVRLY